MSLIDYILTGDALNQTNLQKMIRQLLSDSGLDPDADFPGFHAIGADGLGEGTNGLIALWDTGNKLKEGPANAIGFLYNDGAGALVFKTVNLVTGANDTFFVKGRNNADNADLDILKVNASDEIELGINLNAVDKVVKRATLQDYTEKLQSLGTVSGAQAIDVTLGNCIHATLNNNTQFTVSNWPSECASIHLVLDISGSITITWLAGSVNWGNAGAPTPVSGERLHVTLMNVGGQIDGSWADGY